MGMEEWTRTSSSFTNKQSFSILKAGGKIQGEATKTKDVCAYLLAQYKYIYKEIITLFLNLFHIPPITTE